MASQGSDRLRAIIAAAQEKARAAQAAAPAESTGGETSRVEALLDKREALPDPRALARLYKEKALVERLPEDEESAAAPTAPAPAPAAYQPQPGYIHPPPPGFEVTAATEAPAPPRPEEPQRPPLSPAQIREIMADLKERFEAGSYETYEPKQAPLEVIPTAEDEEPAFEPEEEPRDIFYILGMVFALMVIGVFVFLALNGPLRYHPPVTASPSPSAHR